MKTVDTPQHYIDRQPEPQKSILLEIQNRIQKLFPQSQLVLSYGVPAFKAEKVFFFYGGFKAHVSIFPPLPLDHPLSELLTPYRNDKGNLIFKIKNPMPYDLIEAVSKALYHLYHA